MDSRGCGAVRWALLVVLAVVALPGAVAAEGPSVDLSAAPAEVAIGDPVTVTVTYCWPKNWRVEKTPDPGEDFRAAFVTDAPPPQETATAEGQRRVVKLTLAATRSGAWALPRPSLTASGPQGPVTAQAPAVVVQVGTEATPPKLPEALPLRVRPPAEPASSAGWWWLAGASVVVLIAAAILMRRRATAVAALSPAALFAREIEQLSAVRDPRELGAGLSLAVRRYMGAIWSFDALGSTVREIAARQIGISSSAERFQDLVRVLQQLDDLRWAAGDLAREQVAPQVQAASTLVTAVEAELAAAAAAAANQTPAPGSAPAPGSRRAESSSRLPSGTASGFRNGPGGGA